MPATVPSDLVATLTPIVQRFERFFLNRPPQESTVAQCGDLVFIRWRGILSDPERRMLHADPTPSGREMVEGLYRKIVRQSQEALVGAIESTVGATVSAVFYDVDANADEALLAIAVNCA